MTNTSEMTLAIEASGPALHLRVTLDNHVMFDGEVSCEKHTLTHQFNDDDEAEHVLEIEMSGKLPEHTKISESGEILDDRVITVRDLTFDGIALGHLFYEVSKYHHDFNGTGDPTVEDFFGTMGCNGRVELRFTTPIYLWLLESM
jgi:hypothetical protein